MPIPGLTIEWDDQSDIPPITVPGDDNIDRPIYMVAMTADKGPEEWQHKVRGTDYFDLYGAPSFMRHGQVSIQTAKVVQAGGLVTVKRVVASDSTLANLVLVANLSKESEQDTDENGIFLWQYTDPASGSIVQISSSTMPSPGTGSIPSGVTITPVMVDSTKINFTLESYSIVGNKMATLAKAARNSYDAGGPPPVGTNGSYPLIVFADMGRGISNKRFRIVVDDKVSYPVNYFKYYLLISEGDVELERIPFTLNPYIAEGEYNTSIETAVDRRSKQMRCQFFDDIYDDFIENIEYISGISDASSCDLLFGNDTMNNPIPHFTTNGSPVLDTVYGNPLVGGSNGSFGDAPAQITHNQLSATQMNIVDIALKAAFSGNTEDGDDIYDLDNNRVDIIFDADYHQEVKRAIEQLVIFREDLVFMRDFGLNCNSINQMEIMNQYQAHSRFCCSYMNNYKIYDPYTRRKIHVTVTYDLAILFVDHFINGRIRPFCGQKYGIVIPGRSFIKNSLNFCPKRTPSQDQRKIFDTLRINYLSFYDGDILTMNSEYTSQTRYTQLSWVNNVLGVQEIIKAIRALCPKIRYSFIDGDDLVQYRKDVQTVVIDKYRDRFKSCEIEYVEDEVYDLNKVIYAVIKIKFRNFVQTEMFKIIALN